MRRPRTARGVLRRHRRPRPARGRGVRADRLGDVAEHPPFARLVERGLLLLGPMARTTGRAAIERPARPAGLLLEPGLVDLLVRDVVDEPGALPLLSHALRRPGPAAKAAPSP